MSDLLRHIHLEARQLIAKIRIFKPHISIDIMDSLASSHTIGFRTARILLVMLVVLILCGHSILLSGWYALAGVSASRIIEATEFRSPGDDIPTRIRGVQPGAEDDKFLGLRERNRRESVPAAPDDILLSAATLQHNERTLLADISPPGMWPTPDGQDPAPVVQDEFRRRSLLTGGISPPQFGPWLVMESNEDGEDAFLRRALVTDTSYPAWQWPLIFDRLWEVGTLLKGARAFFTYRFSQARGLASNVHVNSTVVAEDSLQQFKSLDVNAELQQLEANLGSTSLHIDRVQADNSATVEHDMRWSSESEDSDTFKEMNDHAEEHQSTSRLLLQADISPPGMWPDADDDESLAQLSESLLLRRRLLNLGAISRLGLWQVSNDADSFQRRRALLADISPPGMWPDDDDQDQFLEFP